MLILTRFSPADAGDDFPRIGRMRGPPPVKQILRDTHVGCVFHHVDDFIGSEQFLSRQPIFFRSGSTVGAAQNTAVGKGDAQIGDRTSEWIS